MKKLTTTVAFAFLLLSCGENFLDVKPTQNVRVPETDDDYLAMLDNYTNMNQVSCHALGIIGSDEYYITAEQFEAMPSVGDNIYQKNAYVWADQIYVGEEGQLIDWNTAYYRILLANIVLEGLERNIKRSRASEKNSIIQGMALFHRSLDYFNLAQLYCPEFNEETSQRDLGLPLRLEPDITTKTPRSNVSDTYRQIITDLREAIKLLPDHAEAFFRPSKAAAHAVLSKVFLQMGMDMDAYRHADSAISLAPHLMDYTEVPMVEGYSFPLYGAQNKEIIFYTNIDNPSIISENYLNVDTAVLDLYEEGDLRRELFFEENGRGYSFRGSYTGEKYFFTGIASDEVYLIRAEASCRLGNFPAALADLNKLRKYRISPDAFVSYSSNDRNEIMEWIMSERRRELLFRGTRWSDLRRWNKDPDLAVELVRDLDGQLFKLMPGSKKYVWPLPVHAVQFGGYTQN
ncbi:RagB/SusD family nutrient uptake outer membrane protein [Parapedobacter sp.]